MDKGYKMRTLESARKDAKICRKLISDHGSVDGAIAHCQSVIDRHPLAEGNKAWADRIDRLRGMEGKQ